MLSLGLGTRRTNNSRMGRTECEESFCAAMLQRRDPGARAMLLAIVPGLVEEADIEAMEAAEDGAVALRRYLLPVLVSWNLFANHWSRDSIGALEIPLEEEYGLSVRQYNTLSAAYFAPNLPVPRDTSPITPPTVWPTPLSAEARVRASERLRATKSGTDLAGV